MTKLLLVEDNEMNRDMLTRRRNERATRLPSPSMAARAWPKPNRTAQT